MAECPRLCFDRQQPSSCSACVVDAVKLVVYGAAGAGVDTGGQIGGDKIVTEYLGHLNHF